MTMYTIGVDLSVGEKRKEEVKKRGSNKNANDVVMFRTPLISQIDWESAKILLT